jgi:transcription antitermination factor NusG
MSNRQDEIKDIVAQLQGLPIQETELLQRLERLNENESDTFGSAATLTTREFRIGDLVQIKNPKPFQAKKGTIIKIGVGTKRVTVQTKSGSKIVRAPSNLVHIR